MQTQTQTQTATTQTDATQAATAAAAATTVVQSHNIKAQSVWNSPAGHYDEISRSIADAIEHAVERLRPKSGERILDLATGTGWASRIIAQRFPNVEQVIGVDIAEKMLDYASQIASAQKLTSIVRYQHGDAEKLPFKDGELDGVVSTFGVMFAGDPEAAARELARVVKPGGRVVLSTWKPDSNVFNMFAVMKRFMAPPPAGASPPPPPPPPPSPPPSPFEWGKFERVQELLGAKFDLGFEEGTNRFRYSSGEAAWSLWVNSYGPTLSLSKSLDEARREDFKRAMVTWHESDHFRSPLGYEQPRDYLITSAVRR